MFSRSGPWYPGSVSHTVYEIKIQILWKYIFILSSILIIQSGHNFVHVRTALLSAYVQICDHITSTIFNWELISIFKRFGSWAQNCWWNMPLLWAMVQGQLDEFYMKGGVMRCEWQWFLEPNNSKWISGLPVFLISFSECPWSWYYKFLRDSCNTFTHILQGCFPGTGATTLSQCQWSNPKRYG